MSKKILSVILSISCVIGCLMMFAACGSGKESDKADSKDNSKEKAEEILTDDNDDKTDAQSNESQDDSSGAGKGNDSSDASSDTVKGNEGSSEDPKDTASTSKDSIPSVEETEQEYVEEMPENEICTTFCEFTYYDEWKENARFENLTRDDGKQEIACYGVGSIEGYHAFSIIFGNCEGLADHYYIGTIGDTSVYTYVNQNFEGMNDDQIALVNGTLLSHYMNDLTYQLTYVDGFYIER